MYLGANWSLSWGGIARDQEIYAAGTLDDFFGWTHVDVSNSKTPNLINYGTTTPIVPQVLTAADLQAATAEQWESVLVEVASVSVTNPDIGFGEWTVTDPLGSDDIIVDDHLYSLPQQANGWLVSGDPFPAIRGPVAYSSGTFKIEPRDAIDFEP